MAKRKTGVKDYFAFGNMSASLVLKNFPFILFLSFLAVIYIANAHYAESSVREIQRLQSDLKEMRWYYMSLKSSLMYESKRSEVVSDVAPLKLKPLKGRHKKIVVSKKP